jgi:NADH-quinone oxidoreductase subunit C
MTSSDTTTPNPPVPGLSVPVATLKSELESLLGPEALFTLEGKLPVFRVPAEAIHEACRKLKTAGFDYLILVTAVDYPSEQRFELVYVLSNYTDAREVGLVTYVNRQEPTIPTVSDLWDTADWHEREVYDLFGIRFENHPDLRRILLDDKWEGYPLRKDYEDKVHNMIKRPY